MYHARCLVNADTDERHEPSRRSFESRANLQEIKNACTILNTAEYCHTTSVQLEEKLKDKIKAEFAEEISFEPQRQNFTA